MIAFRLATILFVCSGLLPAELTEKEFLSLKKEIQPEPAAWKSIPWHSNLISAQQQAIKDGKPLFIWAMDGHPLGCT